MYFEMLQKSWKKLSSRHFTNAHSVSIYFLLVFSSKVARFQWILSIACAYLIEKDKYIRMTLESHEKLKLGSNSAIW